jgi:bifunctional NMN adenylyltransferase/nudix hydrolase
MENIDVSKYLVGVVIARFQVHELHEGHHYVIKQVVKNHKKTIIFLGVPKFIGTKKNPLDFDTRKKMVQTHYPEAVIVALPDNASNVKWVQELEKRIREVYQHGDVLLYGSRDSFIPYYINNGGKFQTKELKQLGTFTGTDVRKMISEEVRNSVDFRSGVIYHAYNLFPRVVPTVDIAPLNSDNTKVLLAKKYEEDKFRFIGGFVLPTDTTITTAVRRVYYKETGGNSEPTDIQYIDNIQIDDWRFRGEDDKVMSSFFTCKSAWGNITPSDDILELKWCDLDKAWLIENIVDEHKPLIEIFLNKLEENNKTIKDF